MSLIALLKQLNENLPDSVKLVFAPVIRRSLIENPIFLSQYESLKQLDTMNQEETARFHFEKVKKILIFAYEECSFYQKHFQNCGFNPYEMSDISEIEKIPVITKNTLQQEFESFQAKSVNDFYTATTGGSTGKPLHIQLDRESIYKEKAFIYHYWSRAGYDYRKNRIVTFRGVEFKQGQYSRLNPLYNELFLNPFRLNEDNIEEYVALIEKFGAQFIQGYPSIITHFCRLLKRKNIRFRKPVAAVFFISENVFEEHFEIVKEVLKCDCYPFYGHSERSVFAEYDSVYQGYKGNPAYCHLEVDTKDKRIICTGLVNHRMPLIRYKTDDVAEPVKTAGYFKIIGHHSSSVLYGAHGEEISISSINFHTNEFDQVDGYQLEQYEKGKVILHIKAGKNYMPSNTEEIQRVLRKKLAGSLVCEIDFTDNIKLTSRGKHNMLVQHIKHDEDIF